MASAQAAAPPQAERLTRWQKIGYGLGDIYGGGSSTLINLYYLIFLTDVIRLNPALAGSIILISKLYDAVTDPLEGVLSDRTRTRFGRRRPYLFAGIPLIFLSFFALFFPVNFAEESHRFIFVLFSYLFFSTTVSIVMLNYDALQAEMTLDYDERTSLSTARLFFSITASLTVAVVPLELVKQFPDVRQGYIVMALVFGGLFALPFIATVFTARERQAFQKPPQPFSWRATFIEPFKVRTFTLALLMYVFGFVGLNIITSTVVYFMKYYMLRGDEANYVTGVLVIFEILALPFFAAYSRRTSKRQAFILGEIIWVVTMLTSFLISPTSPAPVIYVFAAAAGIGIGGMYVMIYAIFPDIPDVDELKTGERREGTYGALIQLVRKFSQALAIFFVSLALQVAGYVPPIEAVVEGATQLVDQSQTEQFVLLLRALFALAPLVFVSISMYFALRYPLSGDVHERLKRLLAARRAGEPETEQTQTEAAELERILLGSSGKA